MASLDGDGRALGKLIRQNPDFGLGLGGRKQRGRGKREKVSVAAKGSGTKEFPKSCSAPLTSQGVLSALIMFQIRGEVN